MTEAVAEPRRSARREALLPWLVLAGLMAVASVAIYRKGFGTTFYFDDWSFLMDRRPWRSDIFLEPYNGHLCLVPITIYKLLFVTVGIDAFGAFRLTLIAFHLLSVALLFVYARRRVGDALAVLAATALLFLGSAWHDLLVPFQVSFLFSVAATLGALLLLDRGGRIADGGVAVLIALSLASSSLGIPLAAGVLTEVLLREQRWRRLWVPLAPISLYLLWYVEHRDSPQGAAAAVGPIDDILRLNVPSVPAYAADAAAGALAGLAGLNVEWGRPAVVLGAIGLVWRLLVPVPISPRLASLLVTAAAYWALLGVLRAQVTSPAESRYVYFGAVLVLLIAVEMVRGVRLSRRALAVVAAAVAFAAVGNFGALRGGSFFLQEWSAVVLTELGALELAGPETDPAFRPDPSRLPSVTAGAYFGSVQELGSPADSPSDILARSEGHRQIADTTLLGALGIAAVPVDGPPKSGEALEIDASGEAPVRRRGPCLAFRPDGLPTSLDVSAPDGVVVRVRGEGTAEYRLRSFGDTFPEAAHGSLPAGATYAVRIPPRPLPRSWHVRITAVQPVEVCPPP